jgi:probable O-glycosylation ligase (exosortase A-associated)
VRDLAFVGFLALLLAFGFRRPFMFVLAYAYVDIVSPQRLSYYFLNSIPISMVVAALAVGSWIVAEDKRFARFAPRQWLILALLVYAGFTTMYADFPLEAKDKWDWVSKALLWAFFLPLALRTRLRIEAYLLVMTLSVAAIIITGGIKTALGGGGYGASLLFIDNNSGLFESSTISTVAISVIPVILWLARHGTVFPPEWRVRLFAGGLIFACLLIPIGTAARTGLICIAALGLLMLRGTKRRLLYVSMVGLAALAAIPMLPQTFTTRMDTISTYQADSSATGRLAVWGWTWEYVLEHPLGGGFEAYLQNKLMIPTTSVQTNGATSSVSTQLLEDQARAYHSSYFEVLGEQGFPGFILFLLIHFGGLLRMELLRRRYRGSETDPWLAPLATALQTSHLVYLVGSLFVGLAYQPFVYMLVGTQIGLDMLIKRRDREKAKAPFAKAAPIAAVAAE